jgi:hypothetical protein
MSPSTKTQDSKAKHHIRAVECCSHAAQSHQDAARSCLSGDYSKTAKHAKEAQEQLAKALDHGKRASAF